MLILLMSYDQTLLKMLRNHSKNQHLWICLLGSNQLLFVNLYQLRMIERLQKISAQLFKNALKTYTLKDVLTHKRASSHNILEILSLYPNKGEGFFIYRKTWISGVHIEVKRAEFKSLKNAAVYGLKTAKFANKEFKVVDEYPKRLQGLNKRGIWTYDLGNFQSYKTDNGVEYSRADFEAFLKIRRVGISRSVAVEEQQGTEEITPPEAIETE